MADVGADRVTVRELASAAGVPNGTIYHAFGSLGAVLARTWLRAANDFLDLQRELADRAKTGAEDPSAAVVAAALAPAEFAERRSAAARMLLTVERDRLLGPRLPAELADELIGIDARLVSLLVGLSETVWNRRDGAAVEVMTTCVVDLPSALLRGALTGAETRPVPQRLRERLAAAVRAVLTVPPPPLPRRPATTRKQPTTKD
ncbi:regulatory protein, tetR family [Prauserella marina]|uniref:Regulatory protein, tetR family n=1 Tax=Prauserella marina TaxID=530584 RepID=A0A1G6KMW9_9PSEU|nr:TetR family transcriptional regulator [Prauserella marina]SDC31676.1 regulatory protein, tetR family [Prauserella marina]